MTNQMPSRADRPLRADARRNRQRVLEAARDAFVEDGTDAQMEDIARRAGVGVGTIYRHFPTKQALIDTLADQWLADSAAIAAEALELPDAWEALSAYVRRSAEDMMRNRGLRQVYGGLGRLFEKGTGGRNSELVTNVRRLIDRCHQAGVLRADVGFAEFRALMYGLAMATSNADTLGAQQLYADVILKGLRP
ncbi:TetR/AcrR family transcriptional regulator [Streptomyces albus subsp. chlorinus]|uniref:TetR/AcrR family transcriptional regulator n=1 Tax=Streptomyces albus TaxID=1888 RepID=UPI00156ED545|nr:TetR/AcrR family transcriptional regulator [Streptomyces albus]NSC25474.1 TetR/AcrR family transcriptional regulator [Streptomyces albus subsp. chlorinus]